jgi:hypothetical protein
MAQNLKPELGKSQDESTSKSSLTPSDRSAEVIKTAEEHLANNVGGLKATVITKALLEQERLENDQATKEHILALAHEVLQNNLRLQEIKQKMTETKPVEFSFTYGTYGSGKKEESRLDKFMRWLFRVPDAALDED